MILRAFQFLTLNTQNMKLKTQKLGNAMNSINKILFIILMIFMIPGASKAQTPSFYQLNFDYDGDITLLSDWGAMDLTFNGTIDPLYLNLTVDTAWVIENLLVLNLRNVGDLQTHRYWFSLGVPEGIQVSTINYGYTLTNAPSSKPSLTNTSSVTQDYYNIKSGSTGGLTGGVTKHSSSKKIIGGTPTRPPVKHKNFPNQLCGSNECVPAAISNSLKFLEDRHNIIFPGPIDIASMKTAVGWVSGGAPRRIWVERKKAAMKSRKFPITTRIVESRDIGRIEKEIFNGEDVELDLDWVGNGAHALCVNGYADLGSARHQLWVSHAKKQTMLPGDTVTEITIYNAQTKKWEGPLSNGTTDFYFVVECPTKTNSHSSKVAPGGKSSTPNKGKARAKGGVERNCFTGGSNVINDVIISDYSNFTPPSPGGSANFNLTGQFGFNYSSDSGETFQRYYANATIDGIITHAGFNGATEIFNTEILSLTLAGGTFPANINLRESPTLASTGLTFIEPSGPNFLVSSHFDVNFELSTDAGSSWMPEINEQSMMIEATDEPDQMIPTLPEWALIILGLLFALMCIRYIARKPAI